ncbi:C4-dicarboxylate transport sensor protein DctB [mine drainage metagenome]|uniref:histidine kinase n=1 Tax=mine drainage metagenome TaxID=410659 RepID=A0A1J5QHV7_9ZZZZ
MSGARCATLAVRGRAARGPFLHALPRLMVHAARKPFRGRLRTPLLALLGVVLAALAGFASWRAELDAGAAALRTQADTRLHNYAGALSAEIGRYGYLPSLIALDGRLRQLLEHPRDAAAVRAANAYLQHANRAAGSSVAYLMDARGLTLASSNWDTPISFVGANFAFRPYFREALRGQPGRFYGIGTISRDSGLYFSQPLRDGARVIGVLVAKIDLDRVAVPWQGWRDPVLVTDRNGVVLLSSVPAWRFELLAPLPAKVRQHLAQTQQYTVAGPLRPIGLRPVGSAAGAPLWRLEHPADGPFGALPHHAFMANSLAVPALGWRLLSLSDMRPVREAARRSALAGFAIAGLLESLSLVLVLRRRAQAERVAGREALEHAYGELEQRVDARTSALTQANAALQREVDERERAEAALRRTMDELAQAAKMAALGQMAAGVAHELNQPLAALHTLSDNAVVLLDKQRLPEVRGNLDAISGLVRRMARITGDLKSFARKAPAAWQPCTVSAALDGALSLLQRRFAHEGIVLQRHFPAVEPRVMCDELRMQQVLLNLLVNAADAMQGVERRRIDISLEVGAEPGYARLRVADSGEGISAAARERLFEPFFTTKAQGTGLGLGLSIAQRILREVGASIDAQPADGGGAEFVLRLRLADQGVDEHG